MDLFTQDISKGRHTTPSIEAYKLVDRVGQRDKILAVMRRLGRSVCNRELSEILGWQISDVSGRTSEMKRDGEIYEECKKPYKGKTVFHYLITIKTK
jgi:hypothetical protein